MISFFLYNTSMTKRNDYISWDQYFMGIAVLSSERSKDPRTRTGACVVWPGHRIIGVGYNWFPRWCSDDDFPWDRSPEGKIEDSKHGYVVHGEANAILNSMGRDMSEATIYCTVPPCHECTKLIIQAGIKRVVHLPSEYEDRDFFQASKRMLAAANVSIERYSGSTEPLVIEFGEKYAGRDTLSDVNAKKAAD